MVDDDALGVRIIETVNQRSEQCGVSGIQRSVGSKIAKSAIALQTKGCLHRICELVRQQYRNPLEHVHAAEKSIGSYTLERVICVTDHAPAGRPSLAAENRFRITAKRADVVEYPFL